MNIFLTPLGKVVLTVLTFMIFLGAWQLITGLLPLATRKERKRIQLFYKKEKNKKSTANSIDDALQEFSKKLAKHIKLDDIARSEKEKTLRLAKMPYTPEEYMAYMFTVSGCFALVGLFSLVLGILTGIGVFTVIAIGLAIIGVITYVMNNNKLENNRKDILMHIEGELPRYVSFLKMNLEQSNEPILSLMERYHADDEAFKAEYEQAIADAKTSSFDSGLSRWDQRVNSDKLRMVIHGLIAANNGDDTYVYFTMLERDFTSFEIMLLQSQVDDIPAKMMLPKILMYASFALTLFFPLVMQVVEAFKTLFMS